MLFPVNIGNLKKKVNDELKMNNKKAFECQQTHDNSLIEGFMIMNRQLISPLKPIEYVQS